MKYEMVFGDEALFDGAGEFTGIDIVTRNVDDGLYRTSRLSDSTPSTLRKNPVVAMRRIIPEPKRWTWEDKKAGRLPEVGCRAIWHDDNGMKYTVKIETAFFGNECAVSIDDEAIYFAEKFCLFPIETPAEKAARLKAEWCAKAAKQLKNLEYTSTLTSIYDALLSGELAAPKGGE